MCFFSKKKVGNSTTETAHWASTSTLATMWLSSKSLKLALGRLANNLKRHRLLGGSPRSGSTKSWTKQFDLMPEKLEITTLHKRYISCLTQIFLKRETQKQDEQAVKRKTQLHNIFRSTERHVNSFVFDCWQFWIMFQNASKSLVSIAWNLKSINIFNFKIPFNMNFCI